MEKKLNVFFSNSISSHKWGGGEKWMITAAKGLSDRGHNVKVSGKSDSIFLFKAKENNLDTIPFNFFQDFNPFKIWYTKKILIKENIDVIILNLKKDIRVAGISARLANVPVIISRSGIQHFRDIWKHKKTAALVDGIITNTKSISDSYNKFTWMDKNKTKVIYNGLNIKSDIIPCNIKRIWNIPENHIVFVAAGRLTNQKGFDLLINAVSQLKEKTNPFTLLISGVGKEWKNLDRQIKQKGLNRIVKLIGFQNNLSNILKAADFIIMPSRHEGMPNVAMESMALGKPVIASNVNGVSELIHHRKTGYLLDSLNIDIICNAIKFAVENHGCEEIQSWGVAAREHIARNFTLPQMLDQLESYFYSQINFEFR